IMAFPLVSLPPSINQKSIVFDRHGNARISRVAGKVLPVGPQNKTIYVRMHMALLRMPVRHLRNQLGRAVSLRRAALERDRRRLRVPSAAPVNDIMIREVMPWIQLLYRHRLQFWIAPGQCPPLLLA